MYTKDDEIYDFDDFEWIGEGRCANIYRLDDIVLKKYKLDCSYRYFLSKNVFERLKKIHLPNIVTLLEYYYSYPGRLYHMLPFDGYTMKYVDSKDLNILYESTNYLLETITSLEKTCFLLAKNKIAIHDAHHSNIIFHENGATIIDIDLFNICNFSSIKRISLNNSKELFYYIKSELQHQMIVSGYPGYCLDRFVKFQEKVPVLEQFQSILDEETPIKSLEKRL